MPEPRDNEFNHAGGEPAPEGPFALDASVGAPSSTAERLTATAVSDAPLMREELFDAWPLLSLEERLDGFRILPRDQAEDLFFSLGSRDQAELILALAPSERRSWVRLLPPDDVADVVQVAEPEQQGLLLDLLDEPTRKEVAVLLAYAEDEAGGLMNPRYARLRPDMTVDEAISYLRRQKREHVETIYYAYVLDAHQQLLGVVSMRQLVSAPPGKKVREVMKTDLITVPDEMDQEALSILFAKHNLMALPVVDQEGRMKGIVTADDIVAVVKEEATEDIQKIGGMEALGEPYLQISLKSMIKKRAGWLALLFVGETFTATAMGYYEHELKRALVLMLFVPLIISSGGNSGSQACTLIIRAMALGEVKLRDWWRVIRRELATGLALGGILGAIGAVRILMWEGLNFTSYGEHYLLVAVTVAVSLMGIVLWGTLSGSMLPFVLRRLGLDPASASAPFVATLVDVTGLMIYFTVASIVLSKTLLAAPATADVPSHPPF